MSLKNLQKVEVGEYDPNLDAQDEEVVSGGNNRLTYLLLGLIVALVLGYLAIPKGGNGSSGGLSSVTPSFMLDDAAVTAAVPAASADEATSPETAPAADEEEADKQNKTSSKASAASQKTIAAVATATEPAAAPETEAAPEPAAAAAPAASEQSAPANLTISGKIEDENGRPLVGATVLLKGSSKGTSTDANGTYTLEVPAGTDNVLIFGYGGYDDDVVHARGSAPVNVTLTPSAKKSRRR